MGKTTEVRFKMPYVIGGSRRTRRLLSAAALGLSLVCAAPAAAATTASNPLSCVPSGTFTQVFSAFSDSALYTQAPGGNIESPLAGWTLTGGAARVSGNEPYYVGRASDRTSLSIPAGGSAVSAPMCIDQTYPFFRLFARNTGQLKSGLKVDLLFLDSTGKVKTTKSGTYVAGSTAWAPTTSLKIGITFGTTGYGAAPVAFRFTPQGADAQWRIDDVYVDPWARR
jgi:hypothetical protein